MKIRCLAQGHNTWCSRVSNTKFLDYHSGLIQSTTSKRLFFFYFPENSRFDISCNRKQDLRFHAMETICMKCQLKNEKNISKCLLKILLRVLRKGLHKHYARECVYGKTNNKIQVVWRVRSACTLWTCTSVVWSETSLIRRTSCNLWM